MRMIRVTCQGCGGQIECPVSDIGKHVLCGVCFKSNLVPEIQGAAELELLPVAPMVSVGAPEEPPALLRASMSTPAAPPTQPFDPDKALVNIALGMFRFHNWPCQDEPGFRAFRAKVKFHSSMLGVTTVDDFRVSGTRGLLVLESPVIDLPQLDDVPLAQAINEINQRSIAATFVQTCDTVTMHRAISPRPREEGVLTSGLILQTLRQMNHDRRHALTIIRRTVEERRVDHPSVQAAFAQPAAPCAMPALSLQQVDDLARRCGYRAWRIGDELLLSRELTSAERCRVRISACAGFLRGWVAPASVVPASVPAGTAQVERANELNRVPGLVRYVVSRKQMTATAACFPTDQPLSQAEFKAFVEALMNEASGSAHVSSSHLAKAG
ncbi:MAG TPA: hypothetical protein VGP72_19830 [Planctomycetota bacterium]|jgi:hypothetical protein